MAKNLSRFLCFRGKVSLKPYAIDYGDTVKTLVRINKKFLEVNHFERDVNLEGENKVLEMIS